MLRVPRWIAIPVLILAIAGAAWWHPARWTLLLSVPLLGIALYDAVQSHHSLRRNYPLIARVRWLFEALRPFLYAYIVESPLDGRPFARTERDLVYARAKGDLDSHPFGTELDVYSDEYEWMSHSMAPAIAPDRTRRVAVGSSQCSQPYDAALLNISAMSFGSLGANAIEALNRGAQLGGFYHDTGEGGFSPYHRKHGGDIVWELGSGYFGCRDQAGHFDPERFRDAAQTDQIRMIEIKLSQGAKPGHGGVLPGPKVSAEIAATRGVPEGMDCISPVAHSAFSTPVELVLWAAKLRELAGGKPVGIKLCVGQPHEIYAVMKAMIETGVRLDYIVVDGAEGGTGAAPVEFSNRVGMPLREGLIFVRNALVGCGLKEEIRLAASGKVHSGAGLAVNAALGADWSNAARAFMFSLGCVQSLQCHTDRCPTGVATQDPGRQRGLVVEEKAERVRRFQAATVNALWDITCAMGLETPWQIMPHHLHERLNSARSDSIDRIYKFYERGVLLDDPDSVAGARYWAMASADSFRAAL
ncbi:FMN-binding glutamate synthase family protein [Sphingopyxis sp. KK2]|uniref:FMN-binding glutamate synthase family protein n=1 Tax=Sphingopyxis sp. KK2 TaxID=1855727 RepID=UPI0009F83F69|nr:FMN-binding glutamate synthase family protein [Sphingopyxis sp. KK2]